MVQGRAEHRYEEIAKNLLQEIRLGEYRINGKLPSERVLVERFGVQRNTIRRALKLLEDKGQIVIEGKRGSFVKSLTDAPARNTLLLSLHGESSPELAGLYDGFSRVVLSAGLNVRRYDTMPASGAALDPIPKIEEIEPDVAGIALWPQNPTDEHAVNKLNDLLPLVLVDRRVHGVVADCVRFDDVSGGGMVTEHLIAQGHKRIAFLADEVFAETVQHRWQGYAAAHEQHNIEFFPSLSLFVYGINEPYFASYMREVLGRGEAAPTAIVCSNDIVAFALMRFLHDEGIAVPSQVAVTGYGNLMPDFTEAMGLTSVSQSFYQMGMAAANLLVERVNEGSAARARKRKDVRIPVSLSPNPSSRLLRI